MKKRFLSLLTAICLTLTLTPAAFAEESQPDTIVGPNGQVVEIPNMAEPVADIQDFDIDCLAAIPMPLSIPEIGYDGTGTSSDPYRVYSGQGLYNLGRDKFSTTLKTSYVVIMNDIDLTVSTAPDQWNGYFKYFHGVIQGLPTAAGTDESGNTVYTYPTIKGIPSDTYLVYAWFGGIIGNLNFDLAGNAGCITFMPGTLSGAYQTYTMKNITATSSSANNMVYLNDGDNQANYSVFAYAPAGKFTLEKCRNEANITGTSYGAVFFGYYPLDTNGTYVIKDCSNSGNVTMRHTGMFFGNDTAFVGGNKESYALSTNRIQITGCTNTGNLRGTSTVNYFVGHPAESLSTEIPDAYETALLSNTNGNNLPTDKKLSGPALAGLKIETVNGTDIKVTAPTNAPDGAWYRVSVATYLHLYEKEVSGEYRYVGNMRFQLEEYITELPENGIVSLKNYGFTDSTAGTKVSGQVCDHDVYETSGGKRYYYIAEDELSLPPFTYTFRGGENMTFEDATRDPGYVPTYIVSVSVYDSNDVLLDNAVA